MICFFQYRPESFLAKFTLHLVAADSFYIAGNSIECCYISELYKSQCPASMMISCLLSWLTGLLNVVQYVVLMTTFLHWSLAAARELHQLCRYIVELDRLVGSTVYSSQSDPSITELGRKPAEMGPTLTHRLKVRSLFN